MSAVHNHTSLERQYLLLVMLVSIGFFMQALDTTIIYTALPAMAESLHTDPLKMHGAIISYVLAVAAGIPLSGWLADKFGLRNIYFCAILIFTLASLGCGLSTNLNQLIGFRILQGIGGALLLPVGRLAMLKVIPRTQFLSAVSIMNIAGLIGPLMGPALGGWLVKFVSWHWVFFVNIPIGILGMALTLKTMPNIFEETIKKFDLLGFILLIIVMVGFALGIELLSDKASSWYLTAGLLIAALVGSFTYGVHAHFNKNALFQSSLFKNKNFSIGILGNFFARLGGNAIPFILPLMLQVAFQIEPFMAGIMMTPLVIGSLFSKPITRPIIQRLGHKYFLLINTILVGICIASFSLTSADTPIWLRTVHLFIFGILNSLQFVAMNTLTLKDLSQQEASSGNSFLSMVMMLSMSIGIALTGSLINAFTDFLGNAHIVQVFQSTLICLGFINIITAFIFSKITNEYSD